MGTTEVSYDIFRMRSSIENDSDYRTQTELLVRDASLKDKSLTPTIVVSMVNSN